MLNINKDDDLELYTDHIKSLEYLRSIKKEVFDFPENVTNFHVYSEIKSDKELMVIKSYLATQDLEHTKLILWSDYDVTDNPLLEPYKKYIDMRVYDRVKEAEWTILEWCDRWLSANDFHHWMDSWILRFVVPFKHGGAWIDMDTILLNDFKPILDQEWAYVWGQNLDFENFWPIAAIMNIHKWSEHAKICLEEILKTEVEPMTTCLDKDLLAKVYKRRKFTIFPAAFFDTEWSISHDDNEKNISQMIWEQCFSKPVKDDKWLFLDAFAWHWHNSSNKYKEIVHWSKFHKLQLHINKKLKERWIVDPDFDIEKHEMEFMTQSKQNTYSTLNKLKKFYHFYFRPKFIWKKLREVKDLNELKWHISYMFRFVNNVFKK
ncbi:MAG: glycosyltransferase family 32 protein [uncultured bacterium (gcode 4)]|uniref:Glycosyltransferase family 32 protein n=1 Tax=uncultured bacterium (gcode 4) TaxID=1234023 RepID=K2G4S4_9BACT|nr:MAG: glycosyltransferase family 32 protein [uncultured bacterium (gcode 4)]